MAGHHTDRSDQGLVLVVQPTRVDELVSRFNTLEQARFYVEHLGADFSDYVAEHQQYYSVVNRARQLLERLGRLHVLARKFLPNYVFAPDDIVVVVGRDGLVANSLKYLPQQPVIGVNPDPTRWDGVLLPFDAANLETVIKDVFGGNVQLREVTLAEATLNDGQILRAVNDLFIGPRSHTSARYILKSGEREENQSSSGLIVSTGLGSTGWFKSLMVGAETISAVRDGEPAAEEEYAFAWDAPYLHFTVREPFPSRHSKAELVYGRVDAETPLTIVSQMPEHGVIFSDGIESDFLAFNSGTQATIGLSEQRGHLVT